VRTPGGCAPTIVVCVLLVSCPGGSIAVAQAAHGLTCGQIGRAWGNDLFGDVTPRDVVIRAAEQHDDGWIPWEGSPSLDPGTGLPHTFSTAPYTVHLDIHARWSRDLAEHDPYAGLLVTLHHASFFPRPGPVGRLRTGGRRIAAFRNELDRIAAGARASIDADEQEVERNRQLLRTWDGISHDLLVNALPRVRRGVPARHGTVDVAISRGGDHYVVDPWPFGLPEVTVATEGRLLRGFFEDEEVMQRALEEAPVLPLRFQLQSA
jgi:hypothetical protein